TTESVQGKKPFAVVDELKQRLLLAGRETELRIAPVGHRNDQVILGQTWRLQDGRVLANRYFQLFGVLQRFLQQIRLPAVAMMIALSAGEHEYLGAAFDILLSSRGMGGGASQHQ